MRTVLHLTAPAAFGGLERVVGGLARQLTARGEHVVLGMTLEPGTPVPAWATVLEAFGVVVAPLFVGGRAYVTEWRAVQQLVRRHKAQLMHTHGYRSDIIGGLAARSADVRTVSTAHGFAARRLRGKIYEYLQVQALRRFDAVVAVSQPLARTLEHGGIARQHLSVIQNGFVASTSPAVARAEARVRLGVPADAAVIGWVGRLSEEKAPDVMVGAMVHVHHPTAVLCIVGSGPMVAACREQAAALGLGERVVFAGSVADAAPLFSAFDVLALSSRTEGTPMVVLEAAHALVPVVSTSVGGVPDLLGDDGGRLVAPENPAALGAALDAALADGHASAARAAALLRRLSPADGATDWIGQYQALYERLVPTPRRVVSI